MARLPAPQLALKWRERIERFDQSDLTIAQFCRLEGYSTASFYLWRRRLRDQVPSEPTTFVPVQLDACDLRSAVHRAVEIDLPGGAIVKVASDATLDQQRELIAAIVQATSAEVDS